MDELIIALETLAATRIFPLGQGVINVPLLSHRLPLGACQKVSNSANVLAKQPYVCTCSEPWCCTKTGKKI